MRNTKPGKFPGEEQHYGQGEKLGNRPPKRGNFWRSATLVMTIIAALAVLTAVVAIKFPTLVGNSPSQGGSATASQPGTTVLAGQTNATTLSSTPGIQPTVASGLITKNLLLSCGSCNDPIQVTITTIQIDGANGRMVWNMTLKDITGNDLHYGFNEFDLQASGSQTKIPASYSQTQGDLTSDNPYTMQAIFAFVPLQNVTYTLTVNLGFGEFGQIVFNPTQVSF